MSVIIFPGQGSQFVGMSKDFYDNFETARDIFELILTIQGSILISGAFFLNS